MSVGAPALTSRGLTEADFETVVGFLDDAVTIGKHAQSKTSKSLSEHYYVGS